MVLDSKIETLLELSEEYDIAKLRVTIEKTLIKKINDLKLNQVKLYGKAIDHQLDYLMSLLDTSYRYRFKKLKIEAIDYISKQFNQQLIEKNSYYSRIEQDDKLEILRKRLNLLDEKLVIKEKRIKQLEDENLHQKFEIKRLKLNDTNNEDQN